MQDRMIGTKKILRPWGIWDNKRKQKRREQRQTTQEINDDRLQFDFKE